MEASKKVLYEAPSVTVVEVKTVGIVCESQQYSMPGYDNVIEI